MTTNGTIKAALQCRGIPPSMALWYLMGLPAAGPVYYDMHAVAKDTMDIELDKRLKEIPCDCKQDQW